MPKVEAAGVDTLLRTAVHRLADASIPAPELEARWLLSAALGVPCTELWRVDGQVSDDDVSRAEALIAARARGEPLAYVVGRHPFRTLELRTDRRALIPRPETEGLVDIVLTWAHERRGSEAAWGTAVDVGTGSGCIALALAAEGRFDRVVAVERCRRACALARENIDDGGAAVHLVRGDLLAGVARGSIDVLVSNPPYLTEDEYDRLDSGVRSHEPRAALVGGPDGLGVIHRLLHDGLRCLRPGGLLALEIDCYRAENVRDLARQTGWRDVRVMHDLAGRSRYLTAEREE